MSGAGAIGTLTLLSVMGFVALVILNWYFFNRLEGSFLEWLRRATSKQRLYALVDVIVSIAVTLEVLSGVFFLLI
ncbi:MAG: hypothetical protein L7R66_03435 [Candidatus Thalassarchaeaceae archaeon]|nr:hypothetical protein [Candidatus Thalassarchaeaceae archaeon]